MAFTPVRPNDPLDQPSHSGLHNQHSTDIEALQGDVVSINANIDQVKLDHEANVETLTEAHDADAQALATFVATFNGGDVGEVLTKTGDSDGEYDWLPAEGGGTDPGDPYPGISTQTPNDLGLGTDGGLRVPPTDLSSKYDRGTGTLNYANAVAMGNTVKGHDTQLSNLPPKIHISRSDPSGGSNGDVWFKYE